MYVGGLLDSKPFVGCWDYEGNQLYHSQLEITERTTIVSLAVDKGGGSFSDNGQTLVYLSGYTHTEQRASFAAQFDAKTGKQNWMQLYKGENISPSAADQEKDEMEGGSDGASYIVSYILTLNATSCQN